MSRDLSRNRGIPWFSVAIAVLVVAILAIVVLGSFLRPPEYATGQAFYPWFPFGFFWIWPLFGFLFIFLVARWFFWGWGWRSGYRRYYESDAERILAERYAKGEITKEQFEQMRSVLEKHG